MTILSTYKEYICYTVNVVLPFFFPLYVCHGSNKYAVYFSIVLNIKYRYLLKVHVTSTENYLHILNNNLIGTSKFLFKKKYMKANNKRIDIV